jgi:hypothetical protein
MRRKSRLPPIQVILRFYPGQDDDLIHWLRELDEEPTRTKTQALKEALRSGNGAEHGLSGAERPLQATAAAPALDLVEVRRVVEAAVASALSRIEGQVVGAAAAKPAEEDDEVEDLLEGFQYSLVLGDD